MLANVDDIDFLFKKCIMEEKLYLVPGLTFKQACNVMQVNPRLFADYLREVQGTNSFRKIVNFYRIEEAMDIWKDDRDCPIGKVAEAVGFHSRFSFLYWFFRMKW